MAFSPTEKTYYIYILKDPKTEQIRYVGTTYRPKRRLRDHLDRAKKCRTHKEKWINKLLLNNLKPIMEIIEQLPFDKITDRERYWISFYKDQGCNLCNHTSGGEGNFQPDQITINKIRMAQIGKKRKPLTEEHKLKLVKTSTGVVFSKERCENISKAKTGKKFTEYHKLKLQMAKGNKKGAIKLLLLLLNNIITIRTS